MPSAPGTGHPKGWRLKTRSPTPGSEHSTGITGLVATGTHFLASPLRTVTPLLWGGAGPAVRDFTTDSFYRQLLPQAFVFHLFSWLRNKAKITTYYFSNNIVFTSSTVNKHEVNIGLCFLNRSAGGLFIFVCRQFFCTPEQNKPWDTRVAVPRAPCREGRWKCQEHHHILPVPPVSSTRMSKNDSIDLGWRNCNFFFSLCLWSSRITQLISTEGQGELFCTGSCHGMQLGSHTAPP